MSKMTMTNSIAFNAICAAEALTDTNISDQLTSHQTREFALGLGHIIERIWTMLDGQDLEYIRSFHFDFVRSVVSIVIPSVKDGGLDDHYLYYPCALDRLTNLLELYPSDFRYLDGTPYDGQDYTNRLSKHNGTPVDKWMDSANKQAKVYYGFDDFTGEHSDLLDDQYQKGQNPKSAVHEIAQHYELRLLRHWTT